jgi:hypothetical protein
MASINDQILRIWNEWEQTTGADANNPDDFIAWAMDNEKLLPQMQDVRRLLRKQVTSALRQAIRRDEDGFSYRAKQCVTLLEEGAQLRLWFDTDSGGTQNLRQKAVRQRREGIANDVYRAVCDVEHLNKAFSEDPQLNFLTDFSEDCAERRAADLMDNDRDEDKDAA